MVVEVHRCLRGVRTRDGSSLLVRFSTLNDRLEARALDCSGGAAGVVVLCAVPPEVRDDLIALRSLCEKLAPRLIVQDGQLVLGDALVDDYQAASRLQARIRGRNERLHPTKPPARTEDVAAAKLQSRIRGRNERATGRVAQDRAAASLQANVRGHKAREDVGPLDATAQWLRLTFKDQKRHRVVARGSIAISVEILPKEDADNRPAGMGISEPNQNPTLPPRTGRMALSTNPLSVLKELFGPRCVMIFCCCFCLCVFFVLWFYLGMYYVNIYTELEALGFVGGDDTAVVDDAVVADDATDDAARRLGAWGM